VVRPGRPVPLARRRQALCGAGRAAAWLVCAGAWAGSAVAAPAPPPVALSLAPVPGLPAGFMMGADVSTLDQVERSGGRFFGPDGQRGDALQILKDHGVNWVRLRLWHTPVNDRDVIENGRTIARIGEPMGGGNNDLAVTVKLARRAKALGLKLLLDIHYSDHWADPGKQPKPAAWRKLQGAALEGAVYQYTRSTLAALREAGAAPDMVQVGNELNGGFLWPDGKTWQERPDETIGGAEGFARLLAQGIRAVRDSDAPSRPGADPPQRTPVMVHLANGADNTLYRRVFDDLARRGTDYDMIGLSFYPYWHGVIEDLRANMDDISARYGKDVAVVETAYAYTTADADGFPNLFGADSQRSGHYRASVQGQASLVRDVIDAVAQVPGGRGRGVFYWEPAWLGVRGAGWRTGEGNAWDNQAMFDARGRALPSLAVFRLAAGGSGPVPRVQAGAPLALQAFVGEAWAPPQSVRLDFSDDAQRMMWIEWQDFDPRLLQQPGRFALEGRVLGPLADPQAGPLRAEVTVAPRRNLVTDPGFEAGTLAGWTVAGAQAAVSNERNPGNAHAGLQSLHWWLGEPFSFEVSRRFTGLAGGTYTLKAWAAGGGGEKRLELFARDCSDGGGGAKAVAIRNNGWQKWQPYVVEGIAVTRGECTIGLRADAQAGNWGNLDDVEFVKDE
jgi:arabinogalactan endo-1,4-beta-galactosidase